MSARKPGWVNVAAAAAELTRAGDTIDASNVSRYLARNPDIPQEKDGKFRFVDLAALKAHRSTSVYVADKREQRDLEPMRTPVASARPVDEDDDTPAPANSAMAQTKLEIQQLELRKRQREEAIEHGRVVPSEDLQTVVVAMMAAFTAELARQETALTAKFGAQVGSAIRLAHREARTKAAARLKAAAQEVLHPAAAAEIDGPEPAEAAAA